MGRPRDGKVLVEVSDRGAITIPKALRRSNLYEVRAGADGVLELIPQRAIDASQAWFWSGRWQRMEREADADIEAGRVSTFESADALIEELDRI